MKRWYLLVGILISAFFLWLALRGLHLQSVWKALQHGNYLWLIPSVGVYFLAVWARTWRWHYMLRPLKIISLGRLFPVVVIGYMGNNVYPFRAGEVLRSYVLRRRENVAMSASLATVIVERIFDGLVMLMFVFIALPLTPLPSEIFRRIVIIASVVFFGTMLFFFALAAMPQRALRFFEIVLNAFAPQRVREPLMDMATQFLEGLESLRSFRNVLMIFTTSIVIWLLETIKYWFIMQAFPFEVSYFALMLMNGVVNLATTLPSAPGYVGTFDAPGIAVLELYGVDGVIAVAYTLVLHAALWLPITLLGIYYMIREGMGWSDFDRAREMRQGEVVS